MFGSGRSTDDHGAAASSGRGSRVILHVDDSRARNYVDHRYPYDHIYDHDDYDGTSRLLGPPGKGQLLTAR